MNRLKPARPARPWYREYYVWLVLFFPAMAVIGGFHMLYLAISSYDGLVVDDYYKRGLEINRALERDRRAAAYELAADIALNPERAEITIRLSANANFNHPAHIDVALLHATRAGLDRRLKLRNTQKNIYQGNLPALGPGKWYAHIQQDDWRIIRTLRSRR